MRHFNSKCRYNDFKLRTEKGKKENMYYHIPEEYICPFCLIVEGIENEHLYTKQSDIVYKDEFVTAFISSCCNLCCKASLKCFIQSLFVTLHSFRKFLLGFCTYSANPFLSNILSASVISSSVGYLRLPFL